MSIAEELEKLSKLKADGLMTEEEFSQAKAKLLASDGAAAGKPSLEKNEGGGEARTSSSNPLDSLNLDVNQWAMFLHLSQLAYFLVPIVGAVVPIVLWQMKKDDSEIIDKHGKMVTNWIISMAIYLTVSAALFIVFIGAIIFPALLVVGTVFAIIGAMKAKDGIFWEYPFVIKFIK